MMSHGIRGPAEPTDEYVHFQDHSDRGSSFISVGPPKRVQINHLRRKPGPTAVKPGKLQQLINRISRSVLELP